MSHLQRIKFCLFFELQSNNYDPVNSCPPDPFDWGLLFPSHTLVMKIITSKSSRIIFSVSTLCLAFLTLIWVSYIRQRTFDREDSIKYAVVRNSNLAVALEQYAIRTLHNADAVLQLVKMEYALKGDSLNLQKLLINNSLNRDIIEGVSIINRTGRLLMTNIPYPADSVLDFSDRAYFVFHSKNNIDSLLISKPLLSKMFRKPVIVISRRLNDPKGRFVGVVALQVQPSAFTSFYAQAQLLPNDIISLIAPDGTIFHGNQFNGGESIPMHPPASSGH